MSQPRGRGFHLEAVDVAHGQTRLLEHVSAHLPAGRCVAVIGPSGAGKSTLPRLLNRLEEPTAGSVLLDGIPLTDLDILALRRRVGLLAQRPVLLAERIAQEIRVGRPDLPEQAILTLLARVGLPAEFTGRRTTGASGDRPV
jgi:putative ABC transport system ATP-binding protein